jgi:hypothetical protein
MGEVVTEFGHFLGKSSIQIVEAEYLLNMSVEDECRETSESGREFFMVENAHVRVDVWTGVD